MKLIANCLLILVFHFVTLSTCNAKPWWQAMDISTADVPSRYGYHVSRTDAQDKDHYVITLDPAAAAVLEGARIIWPSKPGEDRKMDIVKVNGQKKIEFTVPPDFLQPSSFLQLDSGPIKNNGQEQMADFNGYRLRLDNIPRDTNRKEGEYSIIVSAEIKDEAIAISIDLPQMPTWISYPPDFQFEKLTSATIEGDNLSIPLQSGGILNGGDKIRILLPRSVIKGAILRLNFQVGVTPFKTGTRDIALDTLVFTASKTK
jgi:hypothetical protein